eukprot:2760790-Karenia_brevis.AAC.1
MHTTATNAGCQKTETNGVLVNVVVLSPADGHIGSVHPRIACQAQCMLNLRICHRLSGHP